LDLRDPVLSIGEDAAHRIYFATASNVHFWAEGRSEELLQNGAPLRGADSFYSDRDGNLWIGMLSGGLRLLRNGKISNFQMRDGLYDAEIYGIAADDQDRLWMACSKGIFWVARQDLLRFASGALKKLTSNPYTPTDAQRVIECKAGVQPAAALAGDGRVWFSTIRGMIVLDSRHLQRDTPPPPIVVEDVTVNGEQIAPAEIGALAPGRKNLEFRYTGLTFFAPARLTFRYMVDGYDKDWINAGNRREAYYTNLPPGTNFRFRVVGCNFDGACNEAGTVVFSLASHYYQRVWFWPMVAVAIAIFIWLAYQLRIRRLREHFNVIITERNRIARELHDTLIQGLSGITMELQALAGKMRIPEERTTMGDIIEDAGNCLRETRRSVAGLRSGQSGAGLATAIEQAARQITETKSIKLKLRLGRNGKGLPADVEYNLVRIAQEAVTNSVKHSGARTVEVALDYSPKAVHLSVRDDGTGFARAENGHGRPGHYGLIGMKERATHIGAEFEMASSPGRGTMISVTLPSASNGGHGAVKNGSDS
jgi:signal transduction histidine kinase